MAKKAKKAAAKARTRAGKLTVKKESVRDRPSAGARALPRAIVISSKAMRGMVIDRAAASQLRRSR
ncbi:MAG TPA: hypothetical protein VMT97_01545 [Terriglobales bacterium]|nr:hypothetical protein [Terriglobales bacterium]